MALATRCPACSTIFRISTAQAAAKGGMVRCGQCSNVFNSLDALVRVEDLEVIDEVEVASEGPSDNEVEPAILPHEPAEQAPPFDDLVAISLPMGAPPIDDPSRPVISEWWLPDPNAPQRTGPSSTTSRAGLDPSLATASRDDAGQMLTGRRTDFEPDPAVGIGGIVGMGSTYLEPEPPVTLRRRLVRATLGLMSLVAVVALAGQAAYQWRDEVATRWPAARSFLTAACVPLRCKVGFPVHEDSVTIESTSVQTAAPNSNLYTLTALLRNRDAVDLRYPYLVLVLTDVQDRPILRRALRPEDYLPRRPATSDVASSFPADSELPIRVMFELNDLRFAGYRLEKFYP